MPSLKPENITCLIDSREQQPYDLSPLKMERRGLVTADYTLAGLESECVVERKSLDDLIGCMTGGRERFTSELQRLCGYRHRCVVIEADWADLAEGRYRSSLNPKSATNSIISWTSKYAVTFAFCGDRVGGESFTRNFLYLTAKAHWLKAQAFAAKVAQ